MKALFPYFFAELSSPALSRGERGDTRFDAASGGFIPRSPLAKHSRGRMMKALFPYFFAELSSPACQGGTEDVDESRSIT
jgi:hypothetical protein